MLSILTLVLLGIIGSPIATANVTVTGACQLTQVANRRFGEPLFVPVAVVTVTNDSTFPVGIGVIVTYPDVKDDGTLSENGFSWYGQYQPEDRTAWSSREKHVRIQVAYRPSPGNEGVEIERKTADAVCP